MAMYTVAFYESLQRLKDSPCLKIAICKWSSLNCWWSKRFRVRKSQGCCILQHCMYFFANKSVYLPGLFRSSRQRTFLRDDLFSHHLYPSTTSFVTRQTPNEQIDLAQILSYCKNTLFLPPHDYLPAFLTLEMFIFVYWARFTTFCFKAKSTEVSAKVFKLRCLS